MGRGASPTRPPTNSDASAHQLRRVRRPQYRRGVIGSSLAPLPQLSYAPDLFLCLRPCRCGRLGEASLPTNPSGRGASPTRPPTNSVPTAAHAQYRRGAIGSSLAPLPQLSYAPDFFLCLRPCRCGHAGGVPLPTNPSGRGQELGVGGQDQIAFDLILRRMLRSNMRGDPKNLFSEELNGNPSFRRCPIKLTVQMKSAT